MQLRVTQNGLLGKLLGGASHGNLKQIVGRCQSKRFVEEYWFDESYLKLDHRWWWTFLKPENFLKIAKSWVKKEYALGCHKKEKDMWKDVTRICAGQYSIMHTKEAIRYKWKNIARKCQQFIATRALVCTNMPSKHTVAEGVDNVHRTYCKRTGRCDQNGEFETAPWLQCWDAAAYLDKKRKWKSSMLIN